MRLPPLGSLVTVRARTICFPIKPPAIDGYKVSWSPSNDTPGVLVNIDVSKGFVCVLVHCGPVWCADWEVRLS